jgi:hypothetical protein
MLFLDGALGSFPTVGTGSLKSPLHFLPCGMRPRKRTGLRPFPLPDFPREIPLIITSQCALSPRYPRSPRHPKCSHHCHWLHRPADAGKAQRSPANIMSRGLFPRRSDKTSGHYLPPFRKWRMIRVRRIPGSSRHCRSERCARLRMHCALFRVFWSEAA